MADRLPTGGLPLGHSFGLGQFVFHDAYPLSYKVYEQNSPDAWQEIGLMDALSQLTNAQIDEYCSNKSMFKRKVEGLVPGYPLASATISALTTAAQFDTEWFTNVNTGAQVYFSPQRAAAGLKVVRDQILLHGWLPEDQNWTPDNPIPTEYLLLDQVRDQIGSLNFQYWRQVWFWGAANVDEIDEDGGITDRDAFFSMGFVLMYMTQEGSGDGTYTKWHPVADGEGNTGFWRRRDMGGGNITYTPDFALSLWLKDNEETIIDGLIVIVELVVDVYTMGASAPLFALLNPALFGLVHGMCTGDTKQMLSSIGQMAEQIASYVAQGAASQLTNLIGSSEAGKKTIDFFKSTYNDTLGRAVDGVGKTLSTIYDHAIKDIAASFNTSIDAVLGDASKVTGLPLGKGMLTAAYNMALDKSGLGAITKDVSGMARAAMGVTGWAHDLGASIDFNAAILAKVKPENWNAKNIQAAMHGALEDLLVSGKVPKYAEQAVFVGASVQIISLIQNNKLATPQEADPTFRKIQAVTTTYEGGYVPPELRASYAKSGKVLELAPLIKPLALLAAPSQGAISGKMSKPTAREAVAANAGVPVWGLGPRPLGLGVAFGASAAALALIRNQAGGAILKRPLSPGEILLGASVVTAIYWYTQRNTVNMTPIVVEASTLSNAPPPAAEVSRFERLTTAYRPSGMGVLR